MAVEVEERKILYKWFDRDRKKILEVKKMKAAKVLALVLVLSLVVLGAAACGVPEEDEFEDDMGDDFGQQSEVVQEVAEIEGPNSLILLG